MIASAIAGFDPLDPETVPNPPGSVRVQDGMRKLGIAFLLLVAAVVVAGCGGAGGAETESSGSGLEVSPAGWETDFSEHSVPLSEFRSGGPPRDGIPPIDDPKPVSIGEAGEFLGGEEPVLVVEQGGDARAYPLQILVWHEIVNDELGGRPIGVTYCPLCNSSVVFDRRVEGRELTFGTTGNLRKSDLVMWDRLTESWWQQFSAEAVVGELTGEQLEVLPSQTLSFAAFKRRFPDGDVLSRDTGNPRDYGSNPYAGYDQPDSEPFLLEGEPDGSLPPKERVAAVLAGEDTVVVPFSRLRREPVVNERSGDRPVVFLFQRGVKSVLDATAVADSRDVGAAAVFGRRVGGRTLTFERAPDGDVVDRETGSSWDLTGRARSGPLRGERLPRVRSDVQFWFGLAAFVPDARIAR
jgi:hypothetical protein